MRANLILRLQILFRLILWAIPCVALAQSQDRPNVILIITDDQGYGDLGYTGNPHIKTPTIDRFAAESIRFNNFYVSPVCAPTRASLMTGRYSLRTGIRDTYNGGAIMASNEVTLAEILKEANYSTGIFGKWHLGDNYPNRPQDQGFDESVIHLSGGMGQVGDITTYFKGDTSYFDPVLWHNGKQKSYQGYCSNIFAEQAIDFIKQNRQNPFFCYLSFNAPHTPLQVPDAYYEMYKDIDPSSGFGNDDKPFAEMSEKDKEDARKVYGMVTNIDDNIAKLLQKLNELKISDNTVVILMTDNGPQQVRYVGGLRGRKGSVYQGGIRVPFYFRYPKLPKKSRDIDAMAAHIDVLPTLAEICQVDLPNDREIDGKSLVPLLKGTKETGEERSLFSYWTRRYPQPYDNMALQKGHHKLVAHAGYNAGIGDFELFDTKADPYEQHNIVNRDTTLSITLKSEMDHMYNELIQSENLIDPPRTIIGSEHENPTFLNRNDADGERGIWAQEEIYGKWRVSILEGNYNIRFKFIEPLSASGTMVLETGTLIHQFENKETQQDVLEMTNVYLPTMDCDLIASYLSNSKNILPFWVELERIATQK